jgi:MFS family permease
MVCGPAIEMRMTDPSPRLLLAAVCFAEIVGMAAFATFPSLVPVFQPEWGLSSTEVGWISGVYYAGYVAAVPVLVSLTDRMDARRIYLASMAVSGLAALGFAFLATGLWSASLWRFLQGVGLAGTYMPGLKALTDRLPAKSQSRGVAFYTSSFGIGSSLSFLIAGEIDAVLDWRWAFILSAIGPAVAFVIAARMFRPLPIAGAPPSARLLDFRPVFRNRRVIAYTLAYCVHNAELFALRSWVVAYLVFSVSLQAADAAGTLLRATVIATFTGLVGMPASVLGNELARKWGRPPVLLVVMSTSAIVAVTVGFGAVLPYPVVISLVLVYGFLVTADSATITAGVVEAADPALRGMTMAVHAMIGFIGSALGPILFGVVLDIGGGGESRFAWGLSYSVIAAVLMLGPLFIYTLGRAKLSREPDEDA